MDHMSHHNWEQALDDHHHHAHFDQSQWPYYLQTSSSPGPLLGSPGGLLAAGQATSSFGDQEEDPEEELEATKEMLFKIAAMQPVDVDPAAIRKPRRRNVRISDDPQSVAARLRRERISEKIRILQRLVPGGTKLDTASMLDEAIRYVKFLKREVRILQGEGGGGGHHHQPPPPCLGIPAAAEDWLVVTTKATAASSSYLFGGKNGNDNDNDDDGAGDDGMCFNHRF